MRVIAATLLTIMLATGPLTAQGPGPVGQRGMVRPAASVAEVKFQVTSAARRMGSGATNGMALGFFSGFFGVELLGIGQRGEDRGLLHLFALCAGVVTGWVGYMIGRARD